MSNYLMHTGPNKPVGGYASKNYDPQKAHEYYEKHKQLKGGKGPRNTNVNDRDRVEAERRDRSDRRSDTSSGGRPRYDIYGNKRTSISSVPTSDKDKPTRIKQPNIKGLSSKDRKPKGLTSKGRLSKELPAKGLSPKGYISKGLEEKNEYSLKKPKPNRSWYKPVKETPREKKHERWEIPPYQGVMSEDTYRRINEAYNHGHRGGSIVDRATRFVDNIVFSSPVHSIAQLSDTAHDIVRAGQNFYIDHIRGIPGAVHVRTIRAL